MTRWWKQKGNKTDLSSGMLSHGDCVPCSPGMALDSLDVLGLIVADEIAETKISMANCGGDKGKRF